MDEHGEHIKWFMGIWLINYEGHWRYVFKEYNGNNYDCLMETLIWYNNLASYNLGWVFIEGKWHIWLWSIFSHALAEPSYHIQCLAMLMLGLMWPSKFLQNVLNSE